MILDIVGDLLSKSHIKQSTKKRLSISPVLIIPFHLIWRIKVQWSQKLALASTLCLTILTIMCTITRVAGVRTSSNNSSLDTVWQTYWQFITADIALTMTAATAFRTFFTSRHDKEEHRSESSRSWLGQGWRAFKLVLSPRSWRKNRSALQAVEDAPTQRIGLPLIEERATMTGMRTFIDNQGRD